MHIGIPLILLMLCATVILLAKRKDITDSVMMNWPRNWWKRQPAEDHLAKVAFRLGCSKEEVLRRALLLIDLAAEEDTHIAILDKRQHIRLILESLRDNK